MSATSAVLFGGGAQPAPPVVRITPIGTNFYDPAGVIVRRKSITAFCLPKRAATGRKDEALRFLDYIAAKDLNEGRAFASTEEWTGPPGKGVEPGWVYDEDACVWVLEQAARRGLRIEMVALTHNFGGNLSAQLDQVRRVDALCLAHNNALLEIANEPANNGINVAEIVKRYVPKTPGWASGQATPVPMKQPGLSYHSPRKDEWSRCAKDAIEFGMGSGPEQEFQPPFRGFVMLDEPPQAEQTIRDAGTGDYWPDPADDWRAYGAGAAFFAAGGTIHSNPTFQQCDVPTGTLDACVAAFSVGFEDVPAQRYWGYSGALQPTPSSNPGSRRYRRTGDDGKTYEIRIRPYGFGQV